MEASAEAPNERAPDVTNSATADLVNSGAAKAASEICSVGETRGGGSDLIDGGKVFSDPQREPRFDANQHRALTAEKLAKWFTGILAGGLALHYVCMMILALTGRKEQEEALGQTFHGWFPAITSIVSAVATFYFAKER